MLFKGQLRKKQLMASLVERLEKFMETLKNIFFSLLLLNLIKKGILHFLNAILVCLQGALRKKQLIASFFRHLKGNSWKHLKLIFQSHNSKFKIFHTLFYWLSIWIYRKRVIDHKNSPREILEKILIVLIRLIFLFLSFLTLFYERNFSINHGNKTR